MGSDEKMTVDERYKYLRRLHQRYEKANRGERGRLLDEAEIITGLERKYVCHLLNKEGPIRKKRERQRGVVYDGEIRRAVRIVADALDWICPERLQPALAKTAAHLAGFGELEMSEALFSKLEKISISSVYRLCKDLRKGEPRLPQRRGRPQGDGVSAEIPMTRLAWDISEPGHFEVDLVHHGGPSASGDYLCTMQWIDVATGWSERVAVYGRSAREMKVAFAKILSRCPFPILEIHPDNGSEFMNHPLLECFREKVSGVKLTRSRPYHKNDNRFVEQKNHTLVRAYLGHERLDTRKQCALLNQIYDDMWVYYNIFQPVLRQRAKECECCEGQIIFHRKQDVAHTPFERLQLIPDFCPQALDDLQAIYEVNNPRALKHSIQDQLNTLLSTCQPLSEKEDA